MTSSALTMRLGVWSFLRIASGRTYAKFSRRPVRVVTAEEAKIRRKPLVAEETLAASSKEEEDDSDNELAMNGKKPSLPPGFPPYEKAGKDDTILSRFALDSRMPKKSGLVMLEGKRLIQEALDARVEPKALFFSNVHNVVSLRLPPLKFVFQKVVHHKLKRWSKVTTPPGIMGFFKVPDTSCHQSKTSLPFSIICDNIRDPGNLGSILRVAASAGCKAVILSKGCVNIWNDKVLRSAMGAQFHLCIKQNVEWEAIEKQLEPDAFVMFADNRDSTEELMGSDEGYESEHKTLQNTQSSQEFEDHTTEDMNNAIQGTKRAKLPVLQNMQLPEEFENHTTEEVSNTVQRIMKEELPVFPYYLVQYPMMSHLYLVIGGETGFSSQAQSLGQSQKKFRVTIPMLNNIESLNVSSALAVLTHEIKRQHELGMAGDSLNEDKSQISYL